jgi:pimeloyl-ACP methyl ester carboxylesterase
VLWFDAFFADPADLRKSRGDFCAGSAESRRNKMAAVDRYTFPSLGDWDWRDAVRGIDAPTLAIHGTEDPLPLDGAREWVSLIRGARILILDGVGHFPYLEAPERFFPAADAFLSGK